MDYLLMLNALVFLVLFPIALLVSHLSNKPPLWVWLGLFGLLQGLESSVAMFLPSLDSLGFSLSIRIILLDVSFLCLLEFSRQSCRSLGLRPISTWGYIPLILILITARLFVPSLQCSVLSLPALLGAAWVFWIGRNQSTFLKSACILGGVSLALYGCLAVPFFMEYAVFPLSRDTVGIDRFDWVHWMLALRFVSGLGLASALWIMCWERYSRDYLPEVRDRTRHYERAAIGLVILVLIGSWIGARWVQTLQENHLKEDLIDRTRQAGITLDVNQIGRMNWESPDLNSPEFIHLRKWLGNLLSVVPHCHGTYVTGLRNGKLYFLASSESASAEKSKRSAYLPHLGEFMRTHKPGASSVIGPVADETGTWLIGCYLTPGTQPGDSIAFNLEMPAEKYHQLVFLARLPVLILAILGCLTVMGVASFWTRLRMFSIAQNLELFRIQRQETAISRLANSAASGSSLFQQSLVEITQLAAEALDVARVSIWMADPQWSAARCDACFNAAKEVNERLDTWAASESPSLFDQLSAGNAVESSHLAQNPVLPEFANRWLLPLGIGSVMYIPFFFERRMSGFIAFEHRGRQRPWMKDERQFAGDMANAIVNVLANRRRYEIEGALAASERQFREFVEVLPQIAFETDLSGLFTMVNHSAYELTGYTPDDVRNGLSLFSICLPSTHAQVRENLRRVMAGTPSGGEEYPMLRKDGSLFFGLVYTTLYNRKDNNKSGFRGIVIDITERKKVEEALVESERRLTQIINFLPDATMIIDKDKKIVYWNRAMEVMTGKKAEMMIGKSDYSVSFYGVERPVLIDLLFEKNTDTESKYLNIIRDGDSLVGESTIPCLGPTPVVLWGVARALYDAEGNFVGAIESVRDVTARRKAEDQLRDTHTQLARNYESLVTLLRQQEVNIDLARQVLALINSKPQRHIPLSRDLELCITSQYIPCHAAGGDHYFVHTLKKSGSYNARTILSLKDQSGHEVGCVLRSIVTDLMHNALLRRKDGNSLDAVFTHLNNLICASNLFSDDVFFTSINADIDHETLEMHFLSTGHPPCLLIRGAEVHFLPETQTTGCNLPVGFIGGRQFSMGTAQLQPGDQLLFYTDGLLEIPRWTGGVALESAQLADKVRSLISQDPNRPVSSLAARLLRQLLPEGEFEKISKTDDVALLAFEIEQPDLAFETVLHPKSNEQLSEMIKELTHKVQNEWIEHQIENPEYRLRLALEEALINAWKHGNHADPQKTITVRRRYGNDAIIEVTDQGRGFAHEELQNPTISENRTKASGRGIFVIRLISDDTYWKDNGRTIVICFQNEAYPATRAVKADNSSHLFSMKLWGEGN